MAAYLAVLAVAALTTTLLTPVVGRLAVRAGVVDHPDDRKVHDRAVPTLGGLAMAVGFVTALGLAWFLGYLGWDPRSADGDGVFAEVFASTSEPVGLLMGVIVIVVLGVVDDVRGLSPPLKLAGQILAAMLPVLQGIQIVHFGFPGLGVVVLSPDLGIPLTVLVFVAMVNAVNLVDGLDGLAAGVVAVAAGAFFAFAYGSSASGIAEAAPTSAPLVAAAIAGIAIGFLPHNFHPARIFMGDTGAMLLGLLLAASGVAFVGRTTDPSYADLAGVFPLFIPAIVLSIPVLDTLLAIGRRLKGRRPIAAPDRSHLHHLLLRVGVSHRRAVLTLYFWSAVTAFAAVGLTWFSPAVVGVAVGVLVLAGAVWTIAGMRRPAGVP